jgi:Zn-dependent protease
MGGLDLAHILRALPGIILGFTVHEYAHALAAYRLGDSTSRDEGRLTLNPVKHIDPFGLILLLVAGFGWAKPVRFDPTKFRHPRRDEAIVAMAGPFSNLLLAFLLALCLRLLVAAGGGAGAEVMNTLLTAMFVNLGLFVFNMIPIPPLDGSHLYLPFLKSGNQRVASMLTRYGAFAFFGVIILEQVTRVDILPIGGAVRALGTWILSAVGLR